MLIFLDINFNLFKEISKNSSGSNVLIATEFFHAFYQSLIFYGINILSCWLSREDRDVLDFAAKVPIVS